MLASFTKVYDSNTALALRTSGVKNLFCMGKVVYTIGYLQAPRSDSVHRLRLHLP